MKKYEIAKKKTLTPEISQISVYAPLVAAKAKAGQFIILRDFILFHCLSSCQCGSFFHRNIASGTCRSDHKVFFFP